MKLLQIHPTSLCNRLCEFCSYRGATGGELSLLEVESHLRCAKELGFTGVKFSGGGEPLTHPDISQMIKYAKSRGFTTYLQTNGLLLSSLNSLLECIDDIRISYGDGITFDASSSYISYASGYSYVVTQQPQYGNLYQLACSAMNNDKYLKITQDDTADLSSLPDMNEIKSHLPLHYSPEKLSLISYWDVKHYHHSGFHQCPSAVISPVIGYDGYIYPCCHTQYSRGLVFGYNTNMRVGRELPIVFDGSRCTRCYCDYREWGNYNCLRNERS